MCIDVFIAIHYVVVMIDFFSSASFLNAHTLYMLVFLMIVRLKTLVKEWLNAKIVLHDIWEVTLRAQPEGTFQKIDSTTRNKVSVIQFNFNSNYHKCLFRYYHHYVNPMGCNKLFSFLVLSLRKPYMYLVCVVFFMFLFLVERCWWNPSYDWTTTFIENPLQN